MKPLRVSANGHYLVDGAGRPFFWLGDTAWELFHRLRREEAGRYLRDRAARRFTIIQAVVLAELQGLTTPNAYGDLPLAGRDPTQPNEAYFQHVDWVVNKAADLGLYVGMLPTWGRYVTNAWGEGDVIFTPAHARLFGEYLGERYRQQPIVWVLGGDRLPTGVHEVWQAMAEGLEAGDAGEHLLTYHPCGGAPGDLLPGGLSSSQYLGDAAWLDFHLLQSSRGQRDNPNHRLIGHDYGRRPARPVLDGEPCYEDHPVNWNPANGWFGDHDVRKAAYWAVFAGAAGHTYGCHDIWQFYDGVRPAVAHARTPWQDALSLPGAGQMQHLRALIESHPYLTRIPDQQVILSGEGQAGAHIRATRDGTLDERDATFILVYIPTPQRVTLDTGVLAGTRLRAAWFDPRSGETMPLGEFPNTGVFSCGTPAIGPDWVLVLDASALHAPETKGVPHVTD